MPQYGFRFIESTLYEFTIRCSRCGRVWPDTCFNKWDSADSNTRPFARYVEFQNRALTGQLDCQWGCSQASVLVALARFVMSFFTGRPVFGHGEIVNEQVRSTRQVIPPGLDSVEILNIELAGMREANRIIASSFQS